MGIPNSGGILWWGQGVSGPLYRGAELRSNVHYTRKPHVLKSSRFFLCLILSAHLLGSVPVSPEGTEAPVSEGPSLAPSTLLE